MKKRAKMIDENFSRRRVFMTGMFAEMVKRTSEQLNEFGHGGLLSTVLEVKSLPPEVGNKVLARSVFVLIIFLGNVFMLENLDLTPLENLQKEFDGTGDELTEVKDASHNWSEFPSTSCVAVMLPVGEVGVVDKSRQMLSLSFRDT
jgi:hypothetical protein